jgi:hypothetical protein
MLARAVSGDGGTLYDLHLALARRSNTEGHLVLWNMARWFAWELRQAADLLRLPPPPAATICDGEVEQVVAAVIAAEAAGDLDGIRTMWLATAPATAVLATTVLLRRATAVLQRLGRCSVC